MARAGKKRTHSSKWIRSLLAVGQEPVLRIIETCQQDVADDREVFWIAQRRSEGFNLTNHTDGGGGTRGWHPTDETRANMSRSRKGMVVSEATRLLMSASISASKQEGKGCRVWTDEERAALTARNKGNTYNKGIACTATRKAQVSAKLSGELGTNASTSNEKAAEIRALHASGVRQCELVVRFGLTSSAIYRIVRNKTYKVVAAT